MTIVKNNNTYGAVIVAGILESKNNEVGLISFNIFNLFITIILIMI